MKLNLNTLHFIVKRAKTKTSYAGKKRRNTECTEKETKEALRKLKREITAEKINWKSEKVMKNYENARGILNY
jgi:hypothetical protein